MRKSANSFCGNCGMSSCECPPLTRTQKSILKKLMNGAVIHSRHSCPLVVRGHNENSFGIDGKRVQEKTFFKIKWALVLISKTGPTQYKIRNDCINFKHLATMWRTHRRLLDKL